MGNDFDTYNLYKRGMINQNWVRDHLAIFYPPMSDNDLFD
jgi:hypothetical protein